MQYLRRASLLTLTLLFAVGMLRAESHRQGHSEGSSLEIAGQVGTGGFGNKLKSSDMQVLAARELTWQIHAGYNYFFHENVGVGFGVDASKFSQGIRLNGTKLYPGVIDTDLEIYNHRLTLEDWVEEQDALYVEIPFGLKFSGLGPHVYFIAELGAKVGFNVNNGYKVIGGKTIHTGEYPFWGPSGEPVILSDMPEHGFYTTNDYRPEGSYATKWKTSASVYGKIGMAVPLMDGLDMTFQLCSQYSFSDCYEVRNDAELGMLTDRKDQLEAHYFMPGYTSVLETSYVTGACRPWSVGLEIGFRYTFLPANPCYSCRNANYHNR